MKSKLLICALFANLALAASQPPSIGVPVASKGKAFNPDISANFLALIQGGNQISKVRNDANHAGFSLQEAEVQFSADVDTYFRAVTLLAVGQETNAVGSAVEYGIDPEEVFLETLSLPYVTLKAGKFKLALGKQNQLHAHAYPFIDAPLIHQDLLGDEGLNEVGLSAAVLLPTSWYSEIILQAFEPSNEDLFKSPSSEDMGGLVRLKNLFDLSEDLTAEVGLSGALAKNQFSQNASIYGADLTFKWRPSVGGKYQALIWSTEYLQGNRKGLTDSTSGASQEKLAGLATWLQYQFAERWWVQARYENEGLSRSDAATQPTKNKESFLIGFFPSEFSGLRIQYDHLKTEGVADAAHVFALQYNVSIGAHPAHAY
jgi:hypothetical protein